MLFESKHLRITSEYGIATLWLGFPGEMANALDLDRLRELEKALQVVAANPSVQILVIRSVHPNGFCAGIMPEVLSGLSSTADRAAFSWYGQQVFERLAQLEVVTIALIDGLCLGAGLELALACDYRLCVARSTTQLGFPDRLTCFGGSVRLRNLLGRRAEQILSSGQTMSGREAWKLKLVDLAFCERRAKIELRAFLDRLELHPLKPNRKTELVGLAVERRAFAKLNTSPSPPTPSRGGRGGKDLLPLPPRERGLGGEGECASHNPIPPFPETIGLLGDDRNAAQLAAEVAVLGGRVVVSGNRALVDAAIEATQTRGFITPLEAEQAKQRVRSSEGISEFRNAGLVFVADGHNLWSLATTVLPRAVVCVIASPESQTSTVDRGIRGDNNLAGDDLEEFPYPGRVVQVGFCPRNRIELFPCQTTDSDATTNLAAWLKSLGKEPVIMPMTRFSSGDNSSLENGSERTIVPAQGSTRKTRAFSSRV